MGGKRIKILFLLLVAAGCFQVKQLYRIQGQEKEKWTAAAVKQRLETVWAEKDGKGEIVVLVDAHGRPIPGMTLRYRTSVPEEAPKGIKDLFGQVVASFPLLRGEK